MKDFNIVFERETDGRWLAEIDELPGCMAYGQTKAEAEQAVRELAQCIAAD